MHSSLFKSKKVGKGRPKIGQELQQVYTLQAIAAKDEQKIATVLKHKGKFIIATNELDEAKLSNQELLSHYKEQQSVERYLFTTIDGFLKN